MNLDEMKALIEEGDRRREERAIEMKEQANSLFYHLGSISGILQQQGMPEYLEEVVGIHPEPLSQLGMVCMHFYVKSKDNEKTD